MHARLLLPIVSALVALAPGRASAEPPSLAVLDAMSVTLRCRALCYAPVGRDACLATCPAIDPVWDKDGVTPVEAVDYELALLEYWDAGNEKLVCHVETSVAGVPRVVVKAAPMCAPPVDCSSTPLDDACLDADGDGLRAWQEALSGTANNAPNIQCHTVLDCGFTQTCRLAYGAGQMRCAPRACSAQGCKVFRLEAVSVTSEELIAHVYFDYSPMPVTVLDLKLDYSNETLELLDARPLPLLESAGKDVSVSHLPDGKLRLVVSGAMSLSPVPYGAIVELVFQRTDSTRQAWVSFSDDPVHRRYSMAPEQGAAQAGLTDASLWGDPIQVGAAGDTGPRALLSYTFDDPAAPLIKKVTSASSLCDSLGSWCTLPGRPASLEVLQAGLVMGGVPIDGVHAKGTYVRGGQDHIRFPLTHETATERSFTLSGWFYAEADFGRSGRQLLFSHLAMDERTAFGLELEPEPDNTVDLVWFEGQYDDHATETIIRDHLPRLKWTHVAVSYDNGAGELAFFVDGEKVGTRAYAAGLACPTIEPELGVHLFDSSDVIHFSRPQNGVDELVRADPLGLAVEPLLASGQYSYRDPDYTAGTDRIAYVSNESGAFEIWMADRTGENTRRLTSGFGDGSRGVFARRPKWDPTGHNIVFESNVYDVDKKDNSGRAYQLYYLPVDQLGASGKLEYSTVVSAGQISDYRLTQGDALMGGDAHATGVAWLAPKSGGSRGEIVYTASSADQRTRGIRRMTIDQGGPEAIALNGGDTPLSENAEVLDAHSSADGSVRQLLVERSWTQLTATSQFQAAVTSLADSIEVKVTFEPSGYDALCWDRNGDGKFEPDAEDMDGDGVATTADCYPGSVHDLYLAYDVSEAMHEAALDRTGSEIESLEPNGLAKLVDIEDEFSTTDSLVRIEVSCPRDDRPLRPGVELATIVFTPAVPGATPPFTPKQREGNSAVYLRTLNGATRQLNIGAYLQDARAGAFSPDGTTALLSGIAEARPTLLRVNLASSEEPIRLGQDATVIDSLTYRRQEQIMACNWMGAYRDRYTGLYRGAFTGGLDEVTLYNYPRAEAAIRSESERGHEWLAKAGLDGALASRTPTCRQSDLECPPYMLCNRKEHECETVTCTPGASKSCARGLCTVRPVGAGGNDSPWVCTSECAIDSECFVKECLNGPCRFCDSSTASCVECRETVTKTGSDQPGTVTVEGCPDRNNYSCESGSCYSECISVKDNQSQYLCKAPWEVCEHGRCVVADWSWDNLAPATLCGGGDTAYSPPVGSDDPMAFDNIAISNLIPVRIQAYGISDYLHPPQALVEGCRSKSGQCFEIGEVSVDNQTSAFERHAWYVLETPRWFDRLRLRLVVPPHDNVAGLAQGVVSNAGCPEGVTLDRCFNTPPGSLYMLGYAAEVPYEEVLAAAGKHDDHLGRQYLRAGSPAVIVTGVEVQGTGYSQPSANMMCSYEGHRNPTDPGGRLRKMTFGPNEISNQRTRFEEDGGVWGPYFRLLDLAASSDEHDADAAKRGFAVLNCAFANPDTGIASAEYSVILSEPTQGGIFENANNGCHYESTSGPLCYEWAYRPTLDVLSAEPQLFHTLELEDFGSLGP